ncbi:unnamed protein product [Urochloa humidicola]
MRRLTRRRFEGNHRIPIPLPNASRGENPTTQPPCAPAHAHTPTADGSHQPVPAAPPRVSPFLPLPQTRPHPRARAHTSPDPARDPLQAPSAPPPMEISASAACPPPAKPLLLRPLASSSPHHHHPAPTTSSSSTAAVRRRPPATSSATATVRRRARTRPRTGRAKPPGDAGGDYFSGDDAGGPGFGGSGGGGGGRWSWNNGGFGSGSGSGSGAGGPGDWEPDVPAPAPRRSAAEAALGVVYELMCLIALSNCTQFAVRRLAGLLAARVAALRFVPTVC